MEKNKRISTMEKNKRISLAINVSEQQLQRIDFFAKKHSRSRNSYVTNAVLLQLANDIHLTKLDNLNSEE